MITYRDMTFCGVWKQCAEGDKCLRAITGDVLRRAKENKLPLSITDDFPCFEEVKE